MSALFERGLCLNGGRGHNRRMPPKKPSIPKGYLTTAQVAERLGKSEQAIRDLINDDRLPAKWIGRWIVSEADLVTFVPLKRGRPRNKK